MQPTLDCVITCPQCGTASAEIMPVDACVYFYECRHCGAVLSPREGDCCVFCSFGSVQCPPMQSHASCCKPRHGDA